MTRTITITPILNGFICVVGCQQLAFTSVKSLLDALKAYYETPELTEELFLKAAINKMPANPQQPMPTAPEPQYQPQFAVASAPVVPIGQRIQ